MKKSRKDKRKNRNSSGCNSDISDATNKCKILKHRGDSNSMSVSDILGEENYVLYESSNSELEDASVFRTADSRDSGIKHGKGQMAESGSEPTLKDLMDCMKGISESLNERLSNIEKRLGTIEVLERKVT
ncbi:hypothetical protein DPMN_034074 [Dreissena polymorpha]|uniref:Uncharacterized protein n=1 Tax=Dreissena polymorpha TaxID=45954 RepID=A0A9D4RKJ1_DREPO|nr:hypothetical protein DPMN_034074 [Dreissena polymorpha]